MTYRDKYMGKYKDIISNWGDRTDCEKYAENIDKWLSQFKPDDKPIAFKLLQHFQMYRRIYLEEQIIKLYSKFCSRIDFGINIEEFLPLLSESGGSSNSQFFHNEFEKHTGKKVVNNIEVVKKNDIKIYNYKLVFIDDYSGTGKTFIDTVLYLFKYKPIFKSLIMVFLVMNISELAYDNILNFAEVYKLDIKIIYCKKSAKAFKADNIFSSKENTKVKDDYLKMCKCFNIESEFGYGNTEALIALGCRPPEEQYAYNHNIPNNNLAIFRTKGKNKSDITYIPLFERYNKPKGIISKLKSRKELINKQINKYKKPQNIDDFKNLIFVLYCCTRGKRINLSETCKVFGLTSSQYNKKIDLCIENSYIKLDKGRYRTTHYFSKAFPNINKETRELINKIIKDDYYIENDKFYDIIKYTPVKFYRKFKGYKKEN